MCRIEKWGRKFVQKAQIIRLLTPADKWLSSLLMTSLFVLLTSSLSAQLFGLPHLERFTIFNGLPNNAIRSIHQDASGFLWIGTEDGLCRYNGSDFLPYSRGADDGRSISDNVITSLVSSDSSRLWIGTQTKGLNVYSYRQEHFSYFNTPILRAPDEEFFINAIQPVSDGHQQHIWLGTAQEAMQLTWQADSLQIKKFLPDVLIACFHHDAQTGLWAGTSEGLYLLERENASFRLIKQVPFSLTGEILTLCPSNKGELLIGATKGAFVLKNFRQPANYNLEAIRNPAGNAFKFVNSILQDREERIWIAGQNGLSVLDDQFQFKEQEIQLLRQNRLDKENINKLLLDKEDNLWIGTANNGLIRLFLSNKQFPLFRLNTKDVDHGTADNIVRSIYAESEQTIWIGSYGSGLFRFNRDNMRFRHFLANPKIKGSLSGNQVSSIYRDKGGTLWIGTWGNGLNRAVEEGEQLRFELTTLFNTPIGDDVAQSSIHQLFEDEYDNLWAVTNGGISRRAKDATGFEDMNAFLELPNYNINYILEDNDGNWWLGTWHGLLVYEKEQVQALKKAQLPHSTPPKASYYYTGKLDTAELYTNRITCLFQDQKERIWVATYGGGLSLWTGQSLEKGSFRTFRQVDGLPNEAVYGILEDESERLWLSTNNGLVLFDPALESFQVFTVNDGLQSNLFYFGAYEKTPDGKMIFGGKNGFNIFDPLLFSSRPETPAQVSIDHFYIKGEPVPIGSRMDGSVVLEQSIQRTANIELQPYDNSFRFDFNSSTFNNADRLKYAYQLIGFDEQAQITDSDNRYAIYSNLYEGDYRFEVRASLDGKAWSPVRAINLKIHPPWHRTWWAYTLFGLLILGVIGGISILSYIYSNLQNKLQFEKLNRQKEAEISEMRLWFFTYLSHEFRTPLTLILSPLTEMVNDLQISARVRNKLQMVHRNSNRLLRLVNQILNFRLINTAKLQLSVHCQDIVPFAREIFHSFTQHAQERQIDFQFDSKSPTILLWFDSEKIELVIYNLLSNAFKYSNDRASIRMSLIEEEKDVCLLVEDTGIGIKQSQIDKIFEPFQRATESLYGSSSGIGLALVKNLVEFHKGRIEVESEERKGSKFYIRLPKGKEHFEESQIVNSPPPNATGKQVQWQEAFTETREKLPQVVFSELSEKEKLKLLFVEDNLEIRSYFANYFKDSFVVLQASNGEEGLRQAKKHQPDLIISDVMMPIMDGVQMVKQLKEDSKTNHIPILLLTAKTAIIHQLEGLQKGIFDYIPKPVNIQLLQAKVFACLNNIRQLKEYYKHEGILPNEENHTSSEERFLLKAAQVVEQNLNNAIFGAQEFALQMGVSRSGLYKKLQLLTQKSTTEFIRFVRLKHAEKILKEGSLNISQTAFQVGFNDLKYFRKCFKKEFGLTPTEFIRQQRELLVPK
ncbi:MAG: two-component regulator propeller domain-containing protein [Bacteroidota bacterium]